MAVIAGFSQAAKDTCDGNCDQLSMIKTMAIDFQDGKSDGKIGPVNIDDYPKEELLKNGVNPNAVTTIKQKFKESREAGDLAENSFIGKVKKGVEDYASAKNPDLASFVPTVKTEAVIAKVEDKFKDTTDSRFKGKYFPETG